MIKYVSGVGLDPELRAKIHRQRQIAGSPVQQWVAAFHTKLHDPLAVDWGAMAAQPGGEDEERSDTKDEHSSDNDVSDQLMADFLAGRVSAETGAHIQEQLQDPDSPASRWVVEMRRWAKNLAGLDLRQLPTDDKNAENDSPTR